MDAACSLTVHYSPLRKPFEFLTLPDVQNGGIAGYSGRMPKLCPGLQIPLQMPAAKWPSFELNWSDQSHLLSGGKTGAIATVFHPELNRPRCSGGLLRHVRETDLPQNLIHSGDRGTRVQRDGQG